MAKRSWIAALAAPLVLLPLGARTPRRRSRTRAGAEAGRTQARGSWGSTRGPEPGRTLLRIETTSPSVNFISYTKNPTTFIVDVYGLELGRGAGRDPGRAAPRCGPSTSSTRRAAPG